MQTMMKKEYAYYVLAAISRPSIFKHDEIPAIDQLMERELTGSLKASLLGSWVPCYLNGNNADAIQVINHVEKLPATKTDLIQLVDMNAIHAEIRRRNGGNHDSLEFLLIEGFVKQQWHLAKQFEEVPAIESLVVGLDILSLGIRVARGIPAFAETPSGRAELLAGNRGEHAQRIQISPVG